MASKLHKGNSVCRKITCDVADCSDTGEMVVELDNETGDPMFRMRPLGSRQEVVIPLDDLSPMLLQRKIDIRRAAKIKPKGAK